MKHIHFLDANVMTACKTSLAWRILECQNYNAVSQQNKSVAKMFISNTAENKLLCIYSV